jgi:hypothetical protein
LKPLGLAAAATTLGAGSVAGDLELGLKGFGASVMLLFGVFLGIKYGEMSYRLHKRIL